MANLWSDEQKSHQATIKYKIARQVDKIIIYLMADCL